MQLSVIIPTHHRHAPLARCLAALARQSAPPASFEVIVVADGGPDDPCAAEALPLPYRLVKLKQPPSGAAAARNLGARRARAPLLLFLDDDMEAAPGLVQAHLAAQRTAPGGVVLGRFPLPDSAGPASLLELAVRRWWGEKFAAQGCWDHRFTFEDFCTGNVSLPRDVFEAAGGFDAAFRDAGGEDYDLGARLLQQGVRFRFEPAALSWHHDQPTIERMLQRARTNGAAHVRMAQKYPALFHRLPLGLPVRGTLLPVLAALSWQSPALARRVAGGLRLPLAVAERLRLRERWLRVFGCLQSCAYWQGVQAALGTPAALRALAEGAPREPEPCCEVELDLKTVLPDLDGWLAARQPQALRLRYGALPLGRVPPCPGAEPLRAEHVHALLMQQFAGPLLGAVLAERLSAGQMLETQAGP